MKVATTPTEVEIFRAEVKATCRTTSGTDSPLPLSRGAHLLSETPHRGCRGAPLGIELALLEKLLHATPKKHPDWILLVDRLAETAFVMEYEAFRTCIDLDPMPPQDRRTLGYRRETLRSILRDLARARKTTAFACDALARHPSHRAKAPCDALLPSPPTKSAAAASVEPNASFPAEL